ncbi:hypothetical protein NI17_017995 [Thermobifida halotolerans]|uniref:Uncharacterized protein n=1 Tax=Thermobifida halotolerans TaxID=483545 RepID=A0A399FYE5_9ACTN|nr:hypothetical protein [Thermobifida halotolerans]UOE18676.1 hypothetical protein NI17_017995 [Thermobifida halotolerans]
MSIAKRCGVCALQAPWQPPSGAAEDRNYDGETPATEGLPWQPPSGAAEDRNNNIADFLPIEIELAAAFRDG